MCRQGGKAERVPVLRSWRCEVSRRLLWPGRLTAQLISPRFPGLSLDDRLQRRVHGGAPGQAAGPLLSLPLPHHHELHKDLSQGRQAGGPQSCYDRWPLPEALAECTLGHWSRDQSLFHSSGSCVCWFLKRSYRSWEHV